MIRLLIMFPIFLLSIHFLECVPAAAERLGRPGRQLPAPCAQVHSTLPGSSSSPWGVLTGLTWLPVPPPPDRNCLRTDSRWQQRLTWDLAPLFFCYGMLWIITIILITSIFSENDWIENISLEITECYVKAFGGETCIEVGFTLPLLLTGSSRVFGGRD